LKLETGCFILKCINLLGSSLAALRLLLFDCCCSLASSPLFTTLNPLLHAQSHIMQSAAETSLPSSHALSQPLAPDAASLYDLFSQAQHLAAQGDLSA
jgi:hypothetical protein